jgi:hypothetical protein
MQIRIYKYNDKMDFKNQVIQLLFKFIKLQAWAHLKIPLQMQG